MINSNVTHTQFWLKGRGMITIPIISMFNGSKSP